MKRVAMICLTGMLVVLSASGQYEATWESIDSRANPAWFDEAKFGIFIHWGVYAVPAWGPKERYAEWYWHDMENKDSETWAFHEKTYGAEFQYQDFAPMFKAEMFEPAEWADIFKRSGAKYIVLTSKHHEGFALWPNAESWNWNSVDVGPHRDLCGDLTAAVKDAGLKMGFYFSFYEWFNPIYNSDVDRYVEEHMLPQLTDLVMKYEPDLVWPDGEWEHPSATWRSTEFLAWLFNESPVKDTVAVNDRWGKDCRGQHGGFYTTEYQPDQGKDMDRKWEECRGIGHSFGYNRNENRDNYDTPDTLIERLVDIVAHGGNLLLDIGPTADGRIPVIMQERLLQMGEWMDVNGEAIYGTQPWRVTSDNDRLYYTAKAGAVYAIALDWPEGSLTLNNVKPTDAATVQLLGHDGNLEWERTDDGMTIHVPALSVETTPTHWAHVFKLMGVE